VLQALRAGGLGRVEKVPNSPDMVARAPRPVRPDAGRDQRPATLQLAKLAAGTGAVAGGAGGQTPNGPAAAYPPRRSARRSAGVRCSRSPGAPGGGAGRRRGRCDEAGGRRWSGGAHAAGGQGWPSSPARPDRPPARPPPIQPVPSVPPGHRRQGGGRRGRRYELNGAETFRGF